MKKDNKPNKEHKCENVACTSLDCPERKSLCCGAISMECPHPKEYGGQFDCSACGGWFHGGKRTSSVQDANRQESVGSLSMETQEKIDNKNLINGKKDEQVCGGHEGLCCEHNCKPKEDRGGDKDNQWEEDFLIFLKNYNGELDEHGVIRAQLGHLVSKARAEGGVYKGEVKRIAYQMGVAETRKRVIAEVRAWAKKHNNDSDLVSTFDLIRFCDEMEGSK